MGVFDLYSKRLKRAAAAGVPQLFTYEPLPQPFRVQVVHIWGDALGKPVQYGSPDVANRWSQIHDIIAREKGLFALSYDSGQPLKQCVEWFLKADTDDALDMIELTFRAIEVFITDLHAYAREEQGIKVTPDQAIDELNQRFVEHQLGYEYIAREIIRKDNQYTHEEMIKPALSLIYENGFEKAQEEFLLAHKHHREHRDKDCIVAAQRAFESTLKAICTKMNWQYSKGDRLPELVTAVRKNGLFPEYLDNGLNTYIAMMKTGLPTVRNNAGGHGDDPTTEAVPSYIARYALHLTASNIALAVDAMKRLRANGSRRRRAS